MLKRTATRNLFALCTRLLLNKTKHEAVLAAQAASKAERQKTLTTSKPEGKQVVVEKIVEVERVVKEFAIPEEVLSELASLRAEVTALKNRLSPEPVLYQNNQLKGAGFSDTQYFTVAPKQFRTEMLESSDCKLAIVGHPTYADVEISTKDASRPALSFLRFSRKTAKVVSNLPLPLHYMTIGEKFLHQNLVRTFEMGMVNKIVLPSPGSASTKK
jgi:hypothetical protein